MNQRERQERDDAINTQLSMSKVGIILLIIDSVTSIIIYKLKISPDPNIGLVLGGIALSIALFSILMVLFGVAGAVAADQGTSP